MIDIFAVVRFLCSIMKLPYECKIHRDFDDEFYFRMYTWRVVHAAHRIEKGSKWNDKEQQEQSALI